MTPADRPRWYRDPGWVLMVVPVAVLVVVTIVLLAVGR